MTTTTEQLIERAITRVVITRHGYRIRLPLPAAHTTPQQPEGCHVRVVKRSISAILNSGFPALDPLTGKPIKIYRRGLHQSQVRTLQRLERQHRKYPDLSWIHVGEFSGRRDGDFSKLSHWGLVKQRPREQVLEGEHSRGWWRITDQGRDWLAGRITIPRQVAILEGELLGAVDETDQIRPSDVDDEFSPDRLMAGTDGMQQLGGAA